LYQAVQRFFGDVDGCCDKMPQSSRQLLCTQHIAQLVIALAMTDTTNARYADLPGPSMMIQWPDLGLCRDDAKMRGYGKWGTNRPGKAFWSIKAIVLSLKSEGEPVYVGEGGKSLELDFRRYHL
jgi:hypothetical protein